MASKPKLLDPIPPGELLMEEFMRPLGLSINALARALAVPANRVSAIVNGTRAISADSALRLGKYFGTSPEIWLDLQSDYELRVGPANDVDARRTDGADPSRVSVLRMWPMKYGHAGNLLGEPGEERHR